MSADNPPDAKQFTALIAMTHSAIIQRRRMNSQANSLAAITTDIRPMFAAIRNQLQEYTHHTLRRAEQRQADLEIMYPDKCFDEEGPIKEGEQAWVCTGWATGAGTLRMPKSAFAVQGSRLKYVALPWAWRAVSPLAHHANTSIGTRLRQEIGVHVMVGNAQTWHFRMGNVGNPQAGNGTTTTPRKSYDVPAVSATGNARRRPPKRWHGQPEYTPTATAPTSRRTRSIAPPDAHRAACSCALALGTGTRPRPRR